VFSANQKPFVICTGVTSFALVLQVCTRVTEELHSFLSQSELSNFFVFFILSLKAVHSKRSGGGGEYIIYLFGHHRASLNLNLSGSPTSNAKTLTVPLIAI